MNRYSRREIVGTVCVGGITSISGCLGDSSQDTADANQPVENEEDEDVDEIEDFESDDGRRDSDTEDLVGPPTADRNLPEDFTIDQLNSNAMSGGPPPDGIPSIDNPRFNQPAAAPSNLDDGSPVFGVVLNGEARAYPQNILVWHEIVNDEIGDEAVAITYCPLTGTAQGFYRGDVTFGVSGSLINSNLVMFDRTTRSWWPQILARGIRGPHTGDYLSEFQVIWTTWERWRTAHPDTVVLSEETGFVRNYGRDPYGSYNPPSGYYKEDSMLFPPLIRDDRFAPKDVVIGARTSDGAMCVLKNHLREQRIIEGNLNDIPYVTVYDDGLDTGYSYRNPDGIDISFEDGSGTVTVDNEEFEPYELPLERVIAFDALLVAWFGYYPTTEVHE